MGARTGFQWTITWSYWTYTNSLIPTINVALSAGAPQAANPGVSVSMRDKQQASTPLSGTFSLAIGEHCETVQVVVGEPTESLQAKIESLPGVDPGVDVTWSGSVHDALTYSVAFSSFAGAVPSLRVLNSSGVAGSQPSISVTTVQQGSAELFYGPIPVEFLRVPVASNKAVQLEVNGVPSACGATLEGTAGLAPGSVRASNASTACDFAASIGATPILSGIIPNGTLVPVNLLVSVRVH